MKMPKGGKNKGKNNKNNKNLKQQPERQTNQFQNTKQNSQTSPQKSLKAKPKENQANSQAPSLMKLDTRQFSLEAHEGLTKVKEKLTEEVGAEYCGNASNLVRGLTAYISTWGLHRLSGDMKKFLKGTGSDTKYKGIVYRIFLTRLKTFSNGNFDPDDESTLIKLPLREYTTLNRLSIQLAKEWSFWAVAVLGEAKE
ncbi:MAG: hypothetical protein ACLFRN_05915 [Halothece sp.]